MFLDENAVREWRPAGGFLYVSEVHYFLNMKTTRICEVGAALMTFRAGSCN